MVQKHKLAEKKEQLKQKTKPPGGFDPTPLPDAPPGYTLRFIFHRAWNLPVGDFHLKSADPYLHATLTAAVPRRHKEDPLLTHRTRTLRRTTEPAWEDEWVVANVPASGFTLKCRLYDEDWPDHDDRFGNVTIRVPYVDEHWEGLGPDGRVFDVKKRAGSKRAYLVKGAASVLCRAGPITPRLHVSIKVLGKSAPPHAQMYTVGPTTFVKHYSPMIGRLTGVKVNKDEQADAASPSSSSSSAPKKRDRRTKKYDFQANEIQFSGPVPPRLYHRYVEFRPMIGRMFSSRGLRGRILHKVLHKQHNRIYNFDASTEYGTFAPCSEAATLQFLRMAHFDEGGRIFTYVLTLDGMMRFTETGKEFGIDLLSKHTMHSDVAVYVACAGEFFIRRLARPPNSSTNKPHHPHTPSTHTHPPPEPPDPTANHPPTHPPHQPAGGPPSAPPPPNPRLYQLIIDNDSGTYRPDAAVLPDLRGFLARNLPGLDVAALHCADPRLADLKRAQREAKRRAAGGGVAVALGKKKKKRRAASSAESRLGRMEAEAEEEGARGGTGAAGAGAAAAAGGGAAVRSKRERVFDVVSEPGRWREALGLRASRQGQAAGRA
ncbi:uncharacterized protein THITE_2078678 [Thermothielavioides terrestris NRRL 8126]|uniref:C2 domain-containing protein n=1 Tax=Thermothielavioides terrestris (strain ATCC 38088 / NRRL 8126) TaxID=578455 RepID=G2R7G0_THETT|nr:uncharacterized protein THITE_2078678 [Thermothielavioides terrestris NRRL 8126]AEO67869.1 hypothetical protein THITE_2078678 [Thermothielavioides terrestris NRRL 8126]